MDTNYFWIVMVVLPFSSLDMENSFGVTFEIKVGKDGPEYFCPVFTSLNLLSIQEIFVLKTAAIK